MSKSLLSIVKYASLVLIEGAAFWLIHDWVVSALSPLSVDKLATAIALLAAATVILSTTCVLLLVKTKHLSSAVLSYNPNHYEDEAFGKHFNEFANKTDNEKT